MQGNKYDEAFTRLCFVDAAIAKKDRQNDQVILTGPKLRISTEAAHCSYRTGKGLRKKPAYKNKLRKKRGEPS